MNPSWTPKESSSGLWLERTVYAGQHLGAMGFGAHIVIFFTTVYYILKQRDGTRRIWWLLYVTAMFVCALIYIIGELYADERLWIDQRDYPGGPLAWLEQRENDPPNIIAEGGAIVCLALSDALLLYRCFAVWNHRWTIIILPLLIFFASFIMGCFLTAQMAHPDHSLWSHPTVNFSRPYLVLVLSFNIITSALLVSRLLYMRKQVIASIGPEHARIYTTAATIIMESALPSALYSFVLVMLYSFQAYIGNLMICLLIQVQPIASEIIILRVVRGRAWTRSTATEIMSSLAFHHTTATKQISGDSDDSESRARSKAEKWLGNPSPLILHDLGDTSGEEMQFAKPTSLERGLHAACRQRTEGHSDDNSSAVIAIADNPIANFN